MSSAPAPAAAPPVARGAWLALAVVLGAEGEQLSLLLADQKRYSNLAQNVTQRLASIEFSIARRSVSIPGTTEMAELTLAASLRDQVAHVRGGLALGVLALVLALLVHALEAERGDVPADLFVDLAVQPHEARVALQPLVGPRARSKTSDRAL